MPWSNLRKSPGQQSTKLGPVGGVGFQASSIVPYFPFLFHAIIELHVLEQAFNGFLHEPAASEIAQQCVSMLEENGLATAAQLWTYPQNFWFSPICPCFFASGFLRPLLTLLLILLC